MPISNNRYLTLFYLFLAAFACYAVGFVGGFWVFIAIGALLELTFWTRLLIRPGGRDRKR